MLKYNDDGECDGLFREEKEEDNVTQVTAAFSVSCTVSATTSQHPEKREE